MEAFIERKDIEDIKNFIETSLVKHMNAAGLSFGAMGFVIQTLFDAIDNAKEEFDKEE